MKAYITKYALTLGIIQDEGFNTNPDEFVSFNPKNYCVYKKGEWYKNRIDAKNKAKFMRDEEIRLLEKQIDILKSKTF